MAKLAKAPERPAMPATPATPENAAVDARPRPLPRWTLPAALALLLLVLALAVARLAPPDPLPADAPAARFSAGRARAILEDLAGDGSPRPTGSAAAARARERIVARLAALGYRPRVEEGFACSRGGNCATVRNVVAELPGREPGAVLLSAHYDSVPAGPGISDDLTGVAAVLEVARALKQGPPPRHPVVFLLFEGEENGLVGAEAFAAGSPQAPGARAAVNLEARGSSGPSLMFETSPENQWLMPLLDGSVERPVASSLFQTVYEYLPNDTDFTVLRRRGIGGFNFAFIEEANHYHTAADNLANATPGSLQHHGQNALAVVRALSAADLSRQPPRGRAVFFDVLAYELFWWPAGWGVALALFALALVALTLLLLFRRRSLRVGELALGLLAWLGTVVVTLLLGFGLLFALRLAGAIRTAWPARSLPPQGGIWLLALAVAGFFALRRAGFFGLWAGVWLGWAALGLAVAVLAPGASYLFLIPALAAGLCGPALLAGSRGRAAATLLPVLVAAVLWLPLLLLLYQGLGLPNLFVIGALAAIAATPLLPALGGAPGGWRWGVITAAALLAVVMLIGLVASPPFSAASPQPMNIVFHLDADTGRGQWLVSGPPPLAPALRQAAEFGQPEGVFPWEPWRYFTAQAPALAVPAPELTLLAATGEGSAPGGRRVRLRLASRRGASLVGLALPPSARVQSGTVNGRPLRPTDPRLLPPRAWTTFEVASPAPGVTAEAELDLVLGAAEPLDALVFDRSPGLPPRGAALVKARPASAVAIQEGDNTTVTRKVKI